MPEANTRQFVEIQEIRNDVLILKDGSLRQIIKVGSTNFELKSQDEQLAVLQNFRNFLNSLDFSVEIMIMSRKLNINKYLAFINESAENQQNELLRIQTVDYSKFVQELTQLANIMAKDFFLAIPFYISPKVSKGIGETFKSVFKPSTVVKEMKPEDFESYRIQLSQRVNLVFENVAGMGLAPKPMEQDGLINLYYRLYNPEAIEGIKTQ